MKQVTLCADDYGQSEAISTGILDLVERSRLSAVSCMVNTSKWPMAASPLAAYRHKIDIGLHFNLTQGQPLSEAYQVTYGQFSSLGILMGKSYLGILDQAIIEAECHAQIQEFIRQFGFEPAFIDGHQHVHQFPIIRRALIAVYERDFPAKNVYLRLAKEKCQKRDWINNGKKMVIQQMGRSFEQLLKRHAILHNSSFAGIYPFKQSANYAAFFPQFLRIIEHKGLILCHPGLSTDASQDPLAMTRFHEYAYLKSEDFLTVCQAQNVQIMRFSSV